MDRFVALLRGINVGRAQRIAMADLRALFESLGYTGVRTLLNSGNVVFDAAGPARRHAQALRQALVDGPGLDVAVIVKSAREIAAVVAANPLAGVGRDASRLLVALSDDGGALAALADLGAADWGDDELRLERHAAYLWCAAGILESRAAAALMKRLGGAGTTRNWATLQKIHALLQAPA